MEDKEFRDKVVAGIAEIKSDVRNLDANVKNALQGMNSRVVSLENIVKGNPEKQLVGLVVKVEENEKRLGSFDAKWGIVIAIVSTAATMGAEVALRHIFPERIETVPITAPASDRGN